MCKLKKEHGLVSASPQMQFLPYSCKGRKAPEKISLINYFFKKKSVLNAKHRYEMWKTEDIAKMEMKVISGYNFRKAKA